MAEVSKSSWLSSLHPTDRQVAEKWVAESGNDARLRRIAKAITAAEPRPQGRPKDPKIEIIARAARLYLTHDGLGLGEAASLAVREFFKPYQFKTQQRQIRQRLEQDRPFIRLMAERLHEQGVKVRSDVCPDIAHRQQHERYAQARLSGRIDQFRSRLPSTSRTSLARYTAIMQQLEQRRAIVTDQLAKSRFFEMFDHLIPDETPVSAIKRIYELVEGLIRQEIEDLRLGASKR